MIVARSALTPNQQLRQTPQTLGGVLPGVFLLCFFSTKPHVDMRRSNFVRR
jgi:hypothetical protein